MAARAAAQQEDPAERARTAWEVAADLLDPAEPTNEWWLPNPDPSVKDPDRLYVDPETNLTLVKGRARPKQRPPTVKYFVWVVMSGRGWGKSRTGTEFVDDRARRYHKPGDQMMIAGRTPSDVRDYLLYGPGGLITHHPDVIYEPSKRMLTWPNGVVGIIRSGANPEEFRGFSGGTALCDEFAAWDYPEECWNNMTFGMREGEPRICVTTTPRPLAVLKKIIKAASTIVVKGSSRENAANLSATWVSEVLDPLKGTRLGRQEIEGEILEDVEGALWKLATIEAGRVHEDDVPVLVKVVVGVDPQGVKAPGSETGIVVAGRDAAGEVYVLDDYSINGTPAEWARRAVAAYEREEADLIVGEKNFGGDMVESTIKTVSRKVAIEVVSASRGKIQRAEPVASLYEQGRAHHVGAFPALEDEQCSFTGAPGDRSPNRMDALVWAISKLIEDEPFVLRSALWGK